MCNSNSNKILKKKLTMKKESNSPEEVPCIWSPIVTQTRFYLKIKDNFENKRKLGL